MPMSHIVPASCVIHTWHLLTMIFILSLNPWHQVGRFDRDSVGRTATWDPAPESLQVQYLTFHWQEKSVEVSAPYQVGSGFGDKSFMCWSPSTWLEQVTTCGYRFYWVIRPIMLQSRRVSMCQTRPVRCIWDSICEHSSAVEWGPLGLTESVNMVWDSESSIEPHIDTRTLILVPVASKRRLRTGKPEINWIEGCYRPLRGIYKNTFITQFPPRFQLAGCNRESTFK